MNPIEVVKLAVLKGFMRKRHACRLINFLKYNRTECEYCHRAVRLTIDHIIPRAVGGKNNLDNLQLLCRPCHEKKSREIDGPAIKEIRKHTSVDASIQT